MIQLPTQRYIAPLLFISWLFTSACNESKVQVANEKFAITDSLLKKLQIDTVQQANSKTEIIFSGKITENQELKADIFPMVSGFVKQVTVKIGDLVTKGQSLATITSAEMAGFDKEVLAAKAEVQNATRAFSQAQSLFDSGLSSARELEEAKNDLEIKTAELKRANSVLTLNGGNRTGLYTIKSPISGFVIEKNVNSHMQIRSDFEKSLFTVADISTVWAMVNVYESDIANLKEGDLVQVSVLAYPDRTFAGKIDKLYNLIDQESKVMNARVVIKNTNLELKPGMLATAKVSASTGIDFPVVHSRAIIFDNNKNYVLLIDPNQKVRIQEVQVGRKTGDKSYISKGLHAGDQVISSKQVFLFESLKK